MRKSIFLAAALLALPVAAQAQSMNDLCHTLSEQVEVALQQRDDGQPRYQVTADARQATDDPQFGGVLAQTVRDVWHTTAPPEVVAQALFDGCMGASQ